MAWMMLRDGERLRPPGLGRRGAFRPRSAIPGLVARRAFGVGRRGSFCGGCASACLLILIIAVVIAVLFWKDVNAAIRGIFPSWPLVFVVPFLLYAHYWQSPTVLDGRSAPRSVRDLLMSILRANLEVPFGRHMFRLYLFCHGIPDRCFTIRGHPFPICARCTGLLIGMVAGFLVPATGYVAPIVAIGCALLLVAPLLVDGLTQLAGLRHSTNCLRIVTGAIGGLGVAFVAQVLRLVL